MFVMLASTTLNGLRAAAVFGWLSAAAQEAARAMEIPTLLKQAKAFIVSLGKDTRLFTLRRRYNIRTRVKNAIFGRVKLVKGDC
jgi:hypothetical protein